MRLVVQIPCLDEAETIAHTIGALPDSIAGIDEIGVIVIDDGSRDATAQIAASLGARVVGWPATRGLAIAFMAGIDASLASGADVIVNTDGDNQYRGDDVAQLVAPILAGEADVVIGARPIGEIRDFSWAKKALQRIGSSVLRGLTGSDIVDATSGFRAYSRDAAMQLAVFSRYTYTLETLLQAAQAGLRIRSIPVRVNRVERPSRLARSTVDYIWRAGVGLVRMFVVYKPFRFFIVPAAISTLGGAALVVRFLWFFVSSGGAGGHLQSLVAAVMLFGVGGALAVVALIGDLLAINRRLLQEQRLESRRRRFAARASAHGETRCR
jgi:glycosyltransferase involved in cell wall biosynthesis